MKKRGLKYWLSIISAACCIVYLLLRIFGILDNRMHLTSRYHAYAADTPTWTTRELTIAETIGLYGYTFPVVYTGVDNIDREFSAQLVGSNYFNALFPDFSSWPSFSNDRRLFENIPGGSSWDDTFNPLWFYPSVSNQLGEQYKSDLKRSPYLIYAFTIPIFESHSSLAHPNLRVTVDYQLPLQIIAKEQYILFQRDENARDSGWSFIQHVSTYSSAYNQMMSSQDGLGKGQSVVTPFPSYVDSETGYKMGIIRNDYGSLLLDNRFTVTGERWTFNGCGSFQSAAFSETMLIYVQCPTITTDYVHPLPTTTEPPPVTTRGDFTTYNYTYDLSPLETNQQNQIRIQNQQLQIEMAQLDGINYICWKLDQIYNEMVDRGEIPVNFIQAQTLPRDSDIQDFISHQTSFTLAQLPPTEYFDNADTLTDLMREFTNRFSWFYILGMFSLAMCVVCWIIFKGRG